MGNITILIKVRGPTNGVPINLATAEVAPSRLKSSEGDPLNVKEEAILEATRDPVMPIVDAMGLGWLVWVESENIKIQTSNVSYKKNNY